MSGSGGTIHMCVGTSSSRADEACASARGARFPGAGLASAGLLCPCRCSRSRSRREACFPSVRLLEVPLGFTVVGFGCKSCRSLEDPVPAHPRPAPVHPLASLCAGAGAAPGRAGGDSGAAPALPLPPAAAREAPRPHLPRPVERLVRPGAGGDRLGDR